MVPLWHNIFATIPQNTCTVTWDYQVVGSKNKNLVQIDSFNSLIGARKIFGLIFGVGVRNRAPNKGEPTVSLHHSDVVNLVDVDSNDIENEVDRDKEFVASQGVDLIYDIGSRLLKI